MQSVARKWDIFASVVLSRAPVIAPHMSEVEAKYDTIHRQIEVENSLLCDFELKTKKDEQLLARRAKLEQEGKELSELDGEIGVTNAMRIDEWKKKASNLINTYSLLNAKSSQVNDKTSLQRELDRKLILIVKQKFGDPTYKSNWIVPQWKNEGSESLKQTAERCIGAMTSGSLNATIASNAPFAVHTYRYPKPIRDKVGSDGAKLFFYDAVIGPNSKFQINKDEVAEFCWLTIEEFNKTVPDSKYRSVVKNSLLE